MNGLTSWSVEDELRNTHSLEEDNTLKAGVLVAHPK